VAVLEATERIGGRIETETFPGLPRHRAEFGAMRLASWQKLVLTLAEQLGIEIEPFPMGDEHNFWYLRGRRLHAGELSDPAKVPYGLEGWELGQTRQQLLDHVAHQVLGDRPMPTERRAWDELEVSLRYRGRPVREFGFWNVLADQLSSEAVNFVSDSVGFGSAPAAGPHGRCRNRAVPRGQPRPVRPAQRTIGSRRHCRRCWA